MAQLQVSLSAQLGVGRRELIALVGGGGKSTLMFGLGEELAAAGSRVVLTTTTKMGREQADAVKSTCLSADTGSVIAALERGSPVMLVTGGDDHKVTGPAPQIVDRMYATAGADYVIVEADGSHGRPLKAPASHEPVVPDTATLVVALVGVDAVGQPLGDVTHRVEHARHFTGLDPAHVLTASDCADILLHPEGVLRTTPATARAVVAVSNVSTAPAIEAASAICEAVRSRRPSVDAVILSSID